ncbi:organic solute transporter subunit alpha-like [Petromyzon marinus]|uniref:Organic solute transporter subunit alpha-like isoform X2 n=1 Tax=Petromyzon marinus TaxID=7757 RepID=A0AAJ7WY64_PETMA|nr:organic solute transporter subunit alpha-like isoform X2 [Petromyzon marinus]
MCASEQSAVCGLFRHCSACNQLLCPMSACAGWRQAVGVGGPWLECSREGPRAVTRGRPGRRRYQQRLDMDEQLLVQLNISTSCVHEPPTTGELIRDMDALNWAIIVIFTIMITITTVVYAEEVLYISNKVPCPRRRKTLIWVNGAPPVVALTSCIGLWVPRSAMFTDFASSIYFAVCIHQFMIMIIAEYGGEEAMITRFKGIPIKTSTGPCCCCCLCLPNTTMSRRTLRILKMGTFQVAFLRPVLLFLGAVLWTNGNFMPGVMTVDNGYLWITIVSGTATVLSLYPIGILFNHARFNLANQKIIPKFVLNQSVLILCQLQGSIFTMCANMGSLTCVPPFSARARASYMHQQLLVVEMFVVGLLARCYYRKRYGTELVDGPEIELLKATTETNGAMGEATAIQRT